VTGVERKVIKVRNRFRKPISEVYRSVLRSARRGQRVLGVVRVTDAPADGHGRHYLIERE
jgi:hypothetical protein